MFHQEIYENFGGNKANKVFYEVTVVLETVMAPNCHGRPAGFLSNGRCLKGLSPYLVIIINFYFIKQWPYSIS